MSQQDGLLAPECHLVGSKLFILHINKLHINFKLKIWNLSIAELEIYCEYNVSAGWIACNGMPIGWHWIIHTINTLHIIISNDHLKISKLAKVEIYCVSRMDCLCWNASWLAANYSVKLAALETLPWIISAAKCIESESIGINPTSFTAAGPQTSVI